MSEDIMYLPDGEYYTVHELLLEQNHLLIAGKTGSGKSVVVNGLISCALFKYPGAQAGGCAFILIDPKRVELSMYKNIPHTVKYASEPEDMVQALYVAMSIIENRFQRMQAQGLRKYTGGDVYVVIDEFADLVTIDRKRVTPLVQRIAQLGRAAKVHLILCTQTVLAKILTTEIRCNFDTIIGLHVSRAQDSRLVLGVDGLEKLPKYGKALIQTPEDDELLEWDVPMVEDDEIGRLVKHWEDQLPTWNRIVGK